MTNNELGEEQFECWWYLKTKKATYGLINGITVPFNKKLIVRGIFCDLAAAFNCVTRDIIVSKLSYYGITSKVLEWMQSYPRNMYQ
jgi:hypothetical protein